ncbi:MAG TPA: hypothetical protein VFX35_01305 [Solirubrobacterales bacterium]|nr:hypothetical protein [Solirubrobacterales bacterium]
MKVYDRNGKELRERTLVRWHRHPGKWRIARITGRRIELEPATREPPIRTLPSPLDSLLVQPDTECAALTLIEEE